MRQMCALEYGYLVKELSFLKRKRFSKIWRVEEGYRIKIGSENLICQPGLRMHLTRRISETLPPDGFVEKVRKELRGRILTDISQVNKDRVVSFRFDEYALYFEMFGKGNIVLAKDERTLFAMRFEQWSDREIKRNRPYLPPRAPPDRLEDVISANPIIVSLLKLPVGKEYVEEVLKREGIDEKKPGTELREEERWAIEKTLEGLKEEFRPRGFYKDKKIIDFGLVRFAKYKECDVRFFETLSEVMDEYYSAFEKTNEEIEKLSRRLKKQEEYMEQLKEEEKEAIEKAHAIYSHYQEIESILQTARRHWPEGVEERLKKYKAKINKKEKSIEIEI